MVLSLHCTSEVKDGEFTDSSVTIFNFLRILILYLEYTVTGTEIVRKLYLLVIVSQSQTASALS